MLVPELTSIQVSNVIDQVASQIVAHGKSRVLT